MTGGGVKIVVSHVTNIDVELLDCGGCREGINLCVNDHDDYTLSPESARAIAATLEAAATAHDHETKS